MKEGHKLTRIKAEALHLRTIQGLTLKAIGQKLKRSPACIAVAVHSAIRVCKRRASADPFESLSTRSRCCLQNAGIWDAETLKQKIQDGYDLKRLRNLGGKSIAEIYACFDLPAPIKPPRMSPRQKEEAEQRRVDAIAASIVWTNPHLPRVM